jgi:hypothetical protein
MSDLRACRPLPPGSILVLISVRGESHRLCGLVVRVPGYRSRGPVSISGTTVFSEKVLGLEWGPLIFVSTIEELLGKKTSTPV